MSIGAGEAIFEAIENNNKSELNSLLSEPKNLQFLNEADFYYDVSISTPLIHAVSLGHTELAKILISKGAHVDASVNNQTPLSSAFQAKSNKLDLINLLLDNGADLPTFYSLVPTAFERKQTDLLLALIKNNKIDLNQQFPPDNKTLLHLAIANINQAIIALLLEKGADVEIEDENHQTALTMLEQARINTKYDVYVVFDNPNIRKNHPQLNAIDEKIEKENESKKQFLTACLEGKKEDIETELKKDPKILAYTDEEGRGPLHYAALGVQPEIVELLLKNNASPDLQDKKGYTPLHLVVDNDNNKNDDTVHENICNIIDKLCKYNVNPFLQAQESVMRTMVTPLHQFVKNFMKTAVNKSESEVQDDSTTGESKAEIILTKLTTVWKIYKKSAPKYANQEPIDQSGATPLHWAVKTGNSVMVETLLKAKFNVNAQDSDGNTPLHSAALVGKHEVVSLLIANGANTKLTNKQKETPRMLAEARKNSNFVDALDEKNSKNKRKLGQFFADSWPFFSSRKQPRRENSSTTQNSTSSKAPDIIPSGWIP